MQDHSGASGGTELMIDSCQRGANKAKSFLEQKEKR
jgi:hypothetical protein